jgi:UDP-N-acetylglucosamine--N-acetylmuramyl-(pentapeptide) pyrophosphoryl-undecaprenol N-acetylglucosamine transferase
MKTICYVAGKSGGHIIPCLTLAHQEKQHDATTKTVLICGVTALEIAVAQENKSIDYQHSLPLEALPKKKLWRWPFFVWHLVTTTLYSLQLLRTYRPQKIVTTGGLIAIPICFVGWLLKIPIHSYELNATPGKANKLVSYIATNIFVCFSDAQKFFPSQKCRTVPYPLRPFNTINQQEARSQLNLDPDLPTIFILGGSQGSLFLNQLWKAWLTSQTQYHRLQIIHHIGVYDQHDWQKFYQHNNIPAHLFTFSNQIERYYKAADLVLCRSGAGTLFELEACKVPYITIPLPKRVTPHQHDNAFAMQQQSTLATVLLQEDLEKNPEFFDQMLREKINLTNHQVFRQNYTHNCRYPPGGGAEDVLSQQDRQQRW